MNNNEIIITTLMRIEAKLDAVIKAMHEYDGDEWPEPNDALKAAAAQYKELVKPCAAHDMASWEQEMNERMDIIGQNGNEGLHYDDVEDEYNDYGERVSKDKDNNPDDKRTVGNNKYYRKPNTPVTPKKMEDGVVKHEQYRQPHKH